MRNTVKPETHIVTDAEALSRAAAAEFVDRAKAAVHEKGWFAVALSGGSTPKSLYALLANDTSLWERGHCQLKPN